MFYKKFVKRLLDILVSLIGLPFFLLLFVVMAPVIFLTDRGPVFYNAPRLGKDGRTFKMFKFRSMFINAPDIRNDDGSTYNAADDPRVTPVGRFMRKTSIDELPQLLNVLIGDMSVVGPRPNLVTCPYDELTQTERDRIRMRPGITGYNQAYYRNSVSTAEKYKNDIYYIEHASFALDVKIIFKTLTSVLKHENIYISEPDALIPGNSSEDKAD